MRPPAPAHYARPKRPRRLPPTLPAALGLVFVAGALRSFAIGSPAPYRRLADDPPIDPVAVERGLAHARARRRARIEHERELHRARVRFLFLLLGLVLLTLIIAVSAWQKVQDVFGL